MRRRLIVTTTALVAVALIALSVPLAIAVRGQLTTQAFDTTQGVAEQASLLLDATARSCSELQLRVAQLQDAPATLTVATVDRTLVASTAPTPAAARVAGEPLAAAAAGRVGRAVTDERIVVTVALSTGVCGQPLVLQADQPAAGLTTRIRGAWLAIAGGAVAVAGAAAAFAGWYGRRIARPFEALATSASALGDGDFSARAPRSGIEEADAIAAALDGTAQRLGRTVERASAFTADASHQLRTPLTALRLQLDTAEAVSGTDDPQHDQLRQALAAAHVETDRIEATIEDLVALTRLDAADTEVDLAALVRGRAEGWRATAAEQGRHLEVSAPASGPTVPARPGAIAQILQVLVDNALAHADGPVRVEVHPGTGEVVGADGVAAASAPLVCVVDVGPAPGDAARVAGAGAAEGVGGEQGAAPGETGQGAGVGQGAGAGQGAGPGEGTDGADGEPSYTRAGGEGLPLARALAAAEGGRIAITPDGPGTRACLVLPTRGVR